MVKQYPGVFEFSKQRGESAQNFQDRMRSTNTATTKYNVLPKDKRGIRDTKTAGRQFQHPTAPDNGK
jgi:hypothetical protein